MSKENSNYICKYCNNDDKQPKNFSVCFQCNDSYHLECFNSNNFCFLCSIEAIFPYFKFENIIIKPFIIDSDNFRVFEINIDDEVFKIVSKLASHSILLFSYYNKLDNINSSSNIAKIRNFNFKSYSDKVTFLINNSRLALKDDNIYSNYVKCSFYLDSGKNKFEIKTKNLDYPLITTILLVKDESGYKDKFFTQDIQFFSSKHEFFSINLKSINNIRLIEENIYSIENLKVVENYINYILDKDNPLYHEYANKFMNKLVKILSTNKITKILSDQLILNEEISLKCPFNLKKMIIPVRGINCKHVECFDYFNYRILNLSNLIWKCPVCNSTVYMKDLVIDEIILILLIIDNNLNYVNKEFIIDDKYNVVLKYSDITENFNNKITLFNLSDELMIKLIINNTNSEILSREKIDQNSLTINNEEDKNNDIENEFSIVINKLKNSKKTENKNYNRYEKSVENQRINSKEDNEKLNNIENSILYLNINILNNQKSLSNFIPSEEILGLTNINNSNDETKKMMEKFYKLTNSVENSDITEEKLNKIQIFKNVKDLSFIMFLDETGYREQFNLMKNDLYNIIIYKTDKIYTTSEYILREITNIVKVNFAIFYVFFKCYYHQNLSTPFLGSKRISCFNISALIDYFERIKLNQTCNGIKSKKDIKDRIADYYCLLVEIEKEINSEEKVLNELSSILTGLPYNPEGFDMPKVFSYALIACQAIDSLKTKNSLEIRKDFQDKLNQLLVNQNGEDSCSINSYNDKFDNFSNNKRLGIKSIYSNTIIMSKEEVPSLDNIKNSKEILNKNHQKFKEKDARIINNNNIIELNQENNLKKLNLYSLVDQIQVELSEKSNSFYKLFGILIANISFKSIKKGTSYLNNLIQLTISIFPKLNINSICFKNIEIAILNELSIISYFFSGIFNTILKEILILRFYNHKIDLENIDKNPKESAFTVYDHFWMNLKSISLIYKNYFNPMKYDNIRVYLKKKSKGKAEKKIENKDLNLNEKQTTNEINENNSSYKNNIKSINSICINDFEVEMRKFLIFYHEYYFKSFIFEVFSVKEIEKEYFDDKFSIKNFCVKKFIASSFIKLWDEDNIYIDLFYKNV